MVPQTVTETRTVTVNVPVQEQRQGTRTVCKTVYDSQEQSYTVMVPATPQPPQLEATAPQQLEA